MIKYYKAVGVNDPDRIRIARQGADEDLDHNGKLGCTVLASDQPYADDVGDVGVHITVNDWHEYGWKVETITQREAEEAIFLLNV